MIDQQAPVITIDGPGGSGKGTIAGLLARRLGWNLLDSGALYRLLAFAARNHGVDLTNEAALEALAAEAPSGCAAAITTSSRQSFAPSCAHSTLAFASLLPGIFLGTESGKAWKARLK